MIFTGARASLYSELVADTGCCTKLGASPLLSPLDMALIGGLALVVFGPDQLPKIARRVGTTMREIQNTSHSFIREMERAADEAEFHDSMRPLSVVDPAPAAALSEHPLPEVTDAPSYDGVEPNVTKSYGSPSPSE